MAELVLLGTERSHFTRKVRLLMDHLGLDYDMVDIGNVAEADQSLFGEESADGRAGPQGRRP